MKNQKRRSLLVYCVPHAVSLVVSGASAYIGNKSYRVADESRTKRQSILDRINQGSRQRVGISSLGVCLNTLCLTVAVVSVGFALGKTINLL